MNDLSRIKELADSANELGQNRAYTQAVLQLRKRWFDELLATEDEARSLKFKCQINALEAIQTELNILINDYKNAKK